MKKIYLLLLVLSNIYYCYAQDPQFTQPYAASIYLNPAFAGANTCSRVMLTYRNQWPGIRKTYTTQMLSFDHLISESNIGVGFIVANDLAGTSVLRTNIVSPIVSYHFDISRNYAVQLALQPGVIFKSLNLNNSVFGDQIARGGNVTTIENLPNSKTFFDVTTGGLIYSAKSWLGVSFQHLTQPTESLIDQEESKLPIKYSVHGGRKIKFKKSDKISLIDKHMTVAFNYKGQADFDQFDIGTYFTYASVNFGVWYRGLPGFKAYKPGYSNHDAVALIVGLEADRFNFGYGYDITISYLKTATRGAHELTVAYQFCKLKKKKKNRFPVQCPKF